MHISTPNGYNTALDSLMNRQATMSSTQEQMTTGKRVNRASDDPAAAARAEWRPSSAPWPINARSTRATTR